MFPKLPKTIDSILSTVFVHISSGFVTASFLGLLWTLLTCVFSPTSLAFAWIWGYFSFLFYASVITFLLTIPVEICTYALWRVIRVLGEDGADDCFYMPFGIVVAIAQLHFMMAYTRCRIGTTEKMVFKSVFQSFSNQRQQISRLNSKLPARQSEHITIAISFTDSLIPNFRPLYHSRRIHILNRHLSVFSKKTIPGFTPILGLSLDLD
jgi:hypothetical protein